MSADIDKARAAFELAAPKHGITVERFKQRPDIYKYEYATAMFALWMDAWQARAAIPPSTGVAADSARLQYCLRELLSSLPERRDWFNPDVERELRAMLAAPAAKEKK